MPRKTLQISEKKRLANRRNAKNSTGPKTLEGKKRSSRNAITHGLFCQEVSFLKEELPLFKELRREFIRDLKPQSLLELSFVDSIIENQWKLRRMRISEALAHEQELREQLEAEKKDFKQEMNTKHEPDYAANAAAVGMMQREPDNLLKYSQLQQRLWNMIHRALKELRTCRENQKLIDALPESPFEETVDLVKYSIEDGKTVEEIYKVDEPGEGEIEEEVEEEELEEDAESAERSQLDSDASPSPQPSPLQGEGAGGKAPLTGDVPVNVPPCVPVNVPPKTQNEATAVPTAVVVTRCEPGASVVSVAPPRVMRRY
jgi:hypothetical protein